MAINSGTNQYLWRYFIQIINMDKQINGLPRWRSGKESACNAGDFGGVGSIPGLQRSPGGVNGNPLQYFCLENPMDRGVWQATVHGFSKPQTQLSD